MVIPSSDISKPLFCLSTKTALNRLQLASLLFPLLQLRGGGKGESGAVSSSGGDFAGPLPLRRPVWRRRGRAAGKSSCGCIYRSRVVSRSRICRRRGAAAPVRVRLKAAASSPSRSVFLPRLVGDGGAAVRILHLQNHPSESFRSFASCEVGVCREGAPLRWAFPSGVGETMATAAQRNNVSRLLPRPGGVPLRRHRRGRGAMYRSPGRCFIISVR